MTVTVDSRLAAYLDRIGVADATVPDLPTLQRIIAGHTRAIAFENLDAYTGREVRLDPESLAAKLVHGGRGGWCYEQNLLLRGALDALGYLTTGLAARVMWGQPADAPPGPRGHMLLRVDLPEGPHIVDVGVGMTPTGVLALEPEVEQATPHEPFRLHQDGGPGYVMQIQMDGTWRSLYRFDLTEALMADYELLNWYTSHHPESIFLSAPIAALAEPGRRYTLNGTSFAVHHLDGPTERRTLDSPAEIRKVLEETFQLDTSGLPDLETALARLFATKGTS